MIHSYHLRSFRLRTLIAVWCAAAWLALTPPARSAETAPSACGLSFVVHGEILHRKPPANRAVQGEDPEIFGEEVFGKSFTAVVAGLPEGRYTIEITTAETRWEGLGERVMDIICGDVALAKGLDLIQVAGFRKPYVVRGEVDHADDSIKGPLAIQFTGVVADAKFNAIKILNRQGQTVACVVAKHLTPIADPRASAVPTVNEPAIYLDPEKPVERRVADLIRRMSVSEKIAQLMNSAPAISRLSVPAYDYWNECLHGIARAGYATVFPQATGLAATWDEPLLQRVADAIATEARAKNNVARAQSPNTPRYHGLTFWTPNINIYRDPRWGRGQETYGEDPFLTGRLGVAFIRGLQGDDPRHLKVMACAKHYAVHSGPEKDRHHFNATPPRRDLYETYLPHFEMAVREGKVGSVMAAYNAVDGVPAPASRFLLTELLRERWGFTGHVVSDCGGVRDIWAHHKYTATQAEGTALALKAGCDLECGQSYSGLLDAWNKSLITEQDLDLALSRVLAARFQLGLFDPAGLCVYEKIPAEAADSPAHDRLALETARKSLVLLSNRGALPLKRDAIKRLAVIGPNAASNAVLLGNYAGEPSRPITLVDGIRKIAGANMEVVLAKGCPLALKTGESYGLGSPDYEEAIAAAKSADAVVFVGGLDASLEGEEMRARYAGFDGGDRVRIELPESQVTLLKALHALGKPCILVNCTGGAVALTWETEHLGAVIQAWYPGQNGALAVGELIFGDLNPAGRLPVTFYRSTEDLPDFNDYSMANRTYRYFTGKALFPFGHGLSYTTFAYSPLTLEKSVIDATDELRVRTIITNTGGRDGDEVAQVYVRHVRSRAPQALRNLAAFRRVALRAGEKAELEFIIPASQLRHWDEARNEYVVEATDYEVQIGASSADLRQTASFAVTAGR